MSYAILDIIYGVPLSEEVHHAWDALPEGRLDELGDVDNFYETLYTAGGAFAPGFCGVRLCKTDECGDAQPLSDLRLRPTAKERRIAEARVAALPEEVRGLHPVGVYLVWSTS